MKDKKIYWKFIALILIVGMVIGLSQYLQHGQKFSIEAIQNMVQSAGIWGPVIFFLLYAVTSLIAFPGSILSVASGLVWGPWRGTFYTVISATVASVLPFYLSRLLGRDFIQKVTKQNFLGKCDQFVSKHGFTSIVIARLIPFFPWDIVNFGAGLCGFKFRQYILATLMGIIPGSFLYNSLGAGIGKPFAPVHVVLIVLVVFLGLGSPFIYRKIKGTKAVPCKLKTLNGGPV